jgi:hypothetical protein
MPANASAHKLKVFIGTEDWSRAVDTFDAGYDKRSMSGVIYITGTLTLKLVTNSPGSMNPRSIDGRERWYRGQAVTIECTDSTGSFVKHRFGQLYILKAPQPPVDSLTLELGCILSLKNFEQPDDDQSGVQPGEEKPRHEIINALLEAAGCPPCIDTLPLYPLSAPQAKQGGSYVEQAGKIAYAGLFSLYQDNLGQIRAASIALLLGIPIVTIQEGRDELLYQPSEGSETPCEVLKCAGTGKRLISNYGQERTIDEEYAPAATLDPNADGVILAKYIETVETVDAGGRSRTEMVRAPAGIVSPTAFPRSTSIVLDSYTEEKYLYGFGGNLESLKTTLTRLFVAMCAEYWESLPTSAQAALKLALAISTTRVDYFYTDKDTLEKQVRLLREPVASIVKGITLSDPQALSSGEVEIQRYERTNPRIGKKIETLSQAIGKAFPGLQGDDEDEAASVRTQLSLLQSKRSRLFSVSGQANPPAPERRIEPFTEEEYPLEGKAEFQLAPTVIANQERERTIQVEGGIVAEDQLNKIAQIRGVEIIGSAQGSVVQVPLYDVFLNDGSPFMQVNVVESDGTILSYLTDALQISHSPTEGLVSFQGIWLASTPAGTSYSPENALPPYYSLSGLDLVVPTPPNTIAPLTCGIKAGISASSRPYAFTSELVNLRCGARAGGSVTRPFPDNLIHLPLGARAGVRFGQPGGVSPEISTPQGSDGMTHLVDVEGDDTSVALPDIGFDFPFYDGSYRSDIYAVSNSYLTFGFSSEEYSSLDPTNPGRALHIRSDDRAWTNVWVKAESDRFRVRWEGLTNPGGSDPFEWEVTLFPDGAIMVVVTTIPSSYQSEVVTDGTGSNYTELGLTDNTSLVLLPSGGGYTVQTGTYYP